jgi:hypothetical protein
MAPTLTRPDVPGPRAAWVCGDGQRVEAYTQPMGNENRAANLAALRSGNLFGNAGPFCR